MYLPDKLAPSTEVKTFTPDLRGLIAWLETQDGATEYDCCAPERCLIARFRIACGEQRIVLLSEEISQIYGEAVHDVVRSYGIGFQTRTYGAALDRARAAQ